MPAQSAKEPVAVEPDTADGLPSVDTWSEKDQRIIVSQPAAGFLYDLILRAKIDAHPNDVYAVLKDPRSHDVFRGIKDTLSRTTLQDDGKGHRKLRVGHRAVTKFLWISVTFDTELFIWEDDIERTIKFTNARSDGFMRKFDGTWHVQPFTQHTLDSIYRPQQQSRQQQQQQHGKGWLSPASALSVLQQRVHSSSSSSKQPDVNTLVTLEQALSPKARPPGPVAHLVRGLCARVLQNMMADLRKEVHRRQALAAEECTCGRQDCHNCSKTAANKRSASSFPVASITGSSRSSWQDCHDSRSISRYPANDLCSGVQQLLATAVLLDITIKL